MGLKNNENICYNYKDRHEQQEKEVKENTKQGNRIIKMWEHKEWGNAIYFWDYDKRCITGHLTPLPILGDEIQTKMGSGKIARFKIIDIRYCGDPSDMFFGTVEDMDYVEE